MQMKDVLVSRNIMRKPLLFAAYAIVGGLLLVELGRVVGHAQVPGTAAQPAQPAQASQPAQPTTTPPPPPPDPGPKIPEGFTSIFNGQDLTGWHVSKTNHHGTTPDYRVVHGLIVGTQNPKGKGGILLTDKKYKNFEVYIEIKPDWGCDGGLFLRSSEAGEAYQVTLDYLTGGSMGGIYGERLTGVQGGGRGGPPPPANVQPWQSVWKREAWNTVRARIEGDVPHIQVWINDQLVRDFTDTANHAANGATDGMIAIQMHYSDEKTQRWVDGGFWRWRVIAVKELPAQ
jgi:hypothetical protein